MDAHFIIEIWGFNRSERPISQETACHFTFSALKDPYYKVSFRHRARCEHLGSNGKKDARQKMHWQVDAKSPAFEQKSRREPNHVRPKQHPGISSPEAQVGDFQPAPNLVADRDLAILAAIKKELRRKVL